MPAHPTRPPGVPQVRPRARWLRRGIAAGFAVVLGMAALAPLSSAPASAIVSETYSWRNVQIAGGGFVPGIIFNQSQPNLIYARTDIGGAYRWNQAAGQWVSLLDWVGFDNWGYNGVVSLATDPVDPNRVYAAAGMYTNSWDPDNGAILRSSDQGGTWAVTPLAFKLGGNMPGRGMGERLAIDPNKNSILYLGAPSGNGLWRSPDSGVSWSKVTSFPDPGTYVQQPGDPYLGDDQGVVWVAFDKSTGTAGNATQGIYVGVADPGNTVYRSTDGGATWERIGGQPTGYIAHKGVLDPVNHLLYIATSDTGGPYDGGKGDVWKYDITTRAWTRISPVPSNSSDDYFGYSGLTLDRQHPNTLMVATQISWWPDTILFRSTDGGAHWSRIWDWASYPDRTFRYTQDISAVPWLSFGADPSPPEVTPKLGWMNESVEIDPFDSDRMLYGTGATVYGTTDLRNWDAGAKITIRPMVKGLEETAVQDLISPPSGAPLLSALGDIGGFTHTDLQAVPSLMYTSPNLTTTTSIDFAQLDPSVIVRVGDIDKSANPNVNRVGFSTDGGGNWFQGGEPSGVTGGGTVAEAADGGATVWAPGGAPVGYSTTNGGSWTASTGIPQGAVVESDRVNPRKFYGFAGGAFYVSTNGGAAFSRTAASGLPASGKVHLRALPGAEGEIWLAGGGGAAYGLWHSTDSGTSFTRVGNVEAADNIGFGKAAAGRAYPALYAVARIGGVRGVFRSDDAGATWVRINDDQHQYGNIGDAITGDPRVYGRVYLGTNGRGILYADPASTSPPPDTSPPSAPSGLAVSGKSATSVSLSWSASSDDVGVVAYDVYRGASVAATVTGSPSATSATVSGLSPSTSYSFSVRARDAAGNTSPASNTVSVTTDAASSTGPVKAQYRDNDSAAPSDNQIKPGISLVNTGTAGVGLSAVTIRYWFTSEAGATTYSTWCDFATLGCGNLTQKVVAVSPARTGADHYLEVGFTSGAGTLAAGTSTGDAQLRFNKTDWSNFNETNDYSWSGTQTGYADWTRVTVYVNGTLVWGVEP